MNKNDEIILDITALTGGGDGIGTALDGRIVFVPNTAVGDKISVHIIKVKPNYALGKLKELLSPSPDRAETDCAVANRCGGCVFRHISYQKECEIKYKQVESSIVRIGGIDITPEPIVSSEVINGYRNKAQYPVGFDKNGRVVCGFYTKSSHRIVPSDECLLQPEIFGKIVECFTDWANRNKISVYDEKKHKGLLRHLYIRRGEVTKEIMITVVINADKLPFCEELISELTKVCGSDLKSLQININKEKTNVVLSDKCRTVYGEKYIHDVLCGVKIRLSPLSFYQVNRSMAEKLYSLAAEYAECENKTVLDLYCGAGTIGLSMADTAKQIIGVEIVEPAVEDAKYNAEINGIKNAEFICGDATFAADKLNKRGLKPDVVILDPPRKGCDENLLNLVTREFKPERIVYVSCNDATLARDCKILENLGYKTLKLTPVDMFPRTGHVECVALISRRNS